MSRKEGRREGDGCAACTSAHPTHGEIHHVAGALTGHLSSAPAHQQRSTLQSSGAAGHGQVATQLSRQVLLRGTFLLLQWRAGRAPTWPAAMHTLCSTVVLRAESRYMKGDAVQGAALFGRVFLGQPA